MWRVLLDLNERQPHWTLIGARMVELHALEHGRTLARFTVDADALADARERPNPVRRIAETLVAEGFVLEEPSAFGLGHTFVRDGLEIDVLAPEHLGQTSEEERVTIPPAHTVEVPGGRQAIARTEQVEVDLDGRLGHLPRPNLLGAILIKSRAVEVSSSPDSQRRDLALLLSLVADPELLTGQLQGDEASWLRRRTEIDAAEAECWQGMAREHRQRGLAALRVLAAFA